MIRDPRLSPQFNVSSWNISVTTPPPPKQAHFSWCSGDLWPCSLHWNHCEGARAAADSSGGCHLPESLAARPRADPEGPLVYSGACERRCLQRPLPWWYFGSGAGCINAERSFPVFARRRSIFPPPRGLAPIFREPSELNNDSDSSGCKNAASFARYSK